MSARVINFAAARAWKSGKLSSIDGAWNLQATPVDNDLRNGLELIRARCRHLAQNSDHARGFLRIVRNNLVGAPGYVFQSKASRANGAPDDQTRTAIESAWAHWCRRGHCEVSGKFHWRGLQRHIAETVARDGEAFIRLLPHPTLGLQLQVIDPHAVDVLFSGTYQGRDVVMGVELDDWRRPVAYHINAEPAHLAANSYRTGERYRVPAAEILHIFDPQFCWQTRGVPWMATAATRLNQIADTEDAELTASRASAAKFAAYEAEEWAKAPVEIEGEVGPDGQPLTTDKGEFEQTLAEGTMEVVPYGYKLKLLDPQHPNSAMPEFLKWALRSVSTGMGVSYNTLGNDAEGVNYTSLRFFLGVERDNWQELQDWFEADFIEPVWQAWAESAQLLGLIQPRLPARPELSLAHRWQPRRWEGPDPAKQAIADQTELANGTTTLTEIAARKGKDFDDLLAQRIAELAKIKAAAEAAGLTLEQVIGTRAGLTTTAPWGIDP